MFIMLQKDYKAISRHGLTQQLLMMLENKAIHIWEKYQTILRGPLTEELMRKRLK